MVVNLRKALVAAAAVMLASAFLLWMLRDDEAGRVRKRFDELADLAEVAPGAHIIATGLASSNLGELFTDPATLRTPLYDLGGGAYSRQQIVQNAAAIKGGCERLALEFIDLKTHFPSPDTAVSTVTIRVRGTHRAAGSFDETRELECRLVKEDGAWRFADCTVVDVLVH
ncbi:MAG: hypothetical protein ACOX9C_06105 [Kiritimatiellia bacterium]|jgi:hypothetical protein